MSAQFVLEFTVKPGRVADAVKFAADCSRVFERFGGTVHLYNITPGGDRAARWMAATEFASNAELGAWMDACMGGDAEAARLTLASIAAEAPFEDLHNYILQEVPLR